MVEPQNRSLATSPFLGVGLVLLATSAGLVAAFVSVVRCPECRGQEVAGNCRTGPEDNNLRSITDQVVPPALGNKADVALGYDPKTLQVARRSITARNDAHLETIVETYNELTLNADIPDEKLKLPEEKK